MKKSIVRAIAGFMAFLLFFYSIDINAFASGEMNYDIAGDESVSANEAIEKNYDIEESASENETSVSSNSLNELSDEEDYELVSISENELLEETTPDKVYEKTYSNNGYNISFNVTSSWDTGYNVTVYIENTSESTIHNWAIVFDQSNDINNIWDANVEACSNGTYIIKNNTWNQDIKAGEKISFGFTCDGEFEQLPNSCELLGDIYIVQDDTYSIWYELISDWGSGFQGAIYVKNNTDVTIEDWSLEFDFDRSIKTIWNAEIILNDANHYVINNMGYNANIAPGQTISIGFTGTDGEIGDEPYNYLLSAYNLDQKEYVQLSDGKIEKDYLEKVIYPNLSLYGIAIGEIRLSDDYDGDGLSLGEEYTYDTDPFSFDTDEDGLSDYEEVNKYSTSPVLYDTDQDGMGDGTEVECGLNPLEIDSDKNGVKDNEELTTQFVRIFGLFNYELDNEGTLPELSVTGHGDYSRKINVIKEESAAINDINCVKGSVYDFVHEDDLTFDEATVTYKISNDILSEYELDDLAIAYFDKDTNELQLLETTTDMSNNTISAKVSHLSIYCVISAKEFFYELDLDNYSASIENGKADIVFAIDTTGSMSGPINNVKTNITSFVNTLELNSVDVRLGLVEYKDITFDGIDTTVNYGWYLIPEQFKNKLGSLKINGGGDDPESAVDAIYVASRMNYRNGVNKYIILVTDAGYKNGIKDDPDVTLDNVLVPFDEDYVSVSVVAREGFFSHYSSIVDATNGVYADIYADFGIVLEQLISKISSEVNDKYWIRLANGTVVALDADPHLKDSSVDTDEDGLADIYELGEPIIMKAYNPQMASFVEYEAWTFVSNPTLEDTDGDGVCDTIDLYPTTYDSVVLSEDEESIVFNSGRVWHKINGEIEQYVQDKIHDENGSVNANHIISTAYDNNKENVLKNEKQEFSFDELCYIGVDNNEGSKTYLHLKSSELREKIF